MYIVMAFILCMKQKLLPKYSLIPKWMDLPTTNVCDAVFEAIVC